MMWPRRLACSACGATSRRNDGPAVQRTKTMGATTIRYMLCRSCGATFKAIE